jgi:hypothetical protein
MLGALWILFGLGLDGWAHSNRPELETFFTPWHGVFYSGFLASVAWVGYIIMRRRPHSDGFMAAVPDAYRLSLVGLAIFAVGGVGDGIWHTMWGIESDIDALLSPTHLLMLTGMLTTGAAPIRNAWANPESAIKQSSLKAFLPPLMSATFIAVSVSFFHWYANGFDNWWVTVVYTGPNQDGSAARGILATLVTTAILVGTSLVLLRRWRTPMWSFSILFGVVGIFMAGLEAFESWWQILPAISGGYVFDLVISRNPVPTARSVRLGAMAAPIVMWSSATALFHGIWGVGWTAELWVGQIVMSALVGLGLALVAFPPALPADLRQNTR